MKLYTKAILGSFLALLLALNFSCGNQRNTDDRWNLGTGFRVDGFIPNDGDRNVSLDQPIIVNFSAPIDPSSLDDPNNFKVESLNLDQTLGEKSLVNGIITLTDGNMSVKFIPNLSRNQWETNKTYWITIGQGLLSIDGSRLSQVVMFRFTTGASSVYGANSVPGKPYVIYFEPVTNTPWGDALAFIIEFNEDIVEWPNAYVELSIFGINTGLIPLIPWPMFLNDEKRFYLLFDDYGCNENYYVIGQALKVRVFNGRDIDMEVMDQKEEKFYYLKDYWGGPSNGSACGYY